MDVPVIFRELPATFPEKDEYKKPSIYGSVIFHAFLVVVLVLTPFFTVQKIDRLELLARLVSPIGPPPAPLPEPPQSAAPVQPPAAKAPVTPPGEGALIMPSIVPQEIARVVDVPVAPPSGGVIGGVPGGVPGGVAGGILGGILAADLNREPAVAQPAPPPPPPPPPPPLPPGPVRVGGDIREPRLTKMVPPVYPTLASKARVGGFVVLEAVVTAEGVVDEIKVISGHPLLIQAAIKAVKQWRYEPTYLNGVPVAVMLTAKVEFRRAPDS